MTVLCALSRFSAEIQWMGRSTAVHDVSEREGLERRPGIVVVGDTEAVLEWVLARPVEGAACRLLLLDSFGPDALPERYVATLRQHRALRLVHAVQSHRAGYLHRGIPGDRLVYAPAALGFFPLMLPDFATPQERWTPPPEPQVFAGGRVWRDFETLRRIAARLRVPVTVVTDRDRVRLAPGPYFRPLDQVPFADFCRRLVTCSCAVVPIEANGHNAGQATLALAHYLGVPVVATATPAVSEYVEHRRSGLLVPPRDPVALARAVAHLLRRPDVAHSLSLAAQRASGEREAAAQRAVLGALAELEASA